jgi:hypothetical protein
VSLPQEVTTAHECVPLSMQKATLLSLESIDEAKEYWGEAGGPMGWRLSIDDVRHVLRQRTDFAPDDINALTI